MAFRYSCTMTDNYFYWITGPSWYPRILRVLEFAATSAA